MTTTEKELLSRKLKEEINGNQVRVHVYKPWKNIERVVEIIDKETQKCLR